MTFRYLFFFMSVVFTNTAFSLNVIADNGGEPLKPYLDSLTSDKEKSDKESIKNISKSINKRGISEAIYGMNPYPVTTSYKPGVFKSKDFIKKQNLSQPIAIIGNDGISNKWLKKHHKRLSSLNAIVMVTNVNSALEMKKITYSYNNLIFVPQSAAAIFTQMEINKYPVLITNDGVYQ